MRTAAAEDRIPAAAGISPDEGLGPAAYKRFSVS
jgi:hypothetical protein